MYFIAYYSIEQGRVSNPANHNIFDCKSFCLLRRTMNIGFNLPKRGLSSNYLFDFQSVETVKSSQVKSECMFRFSHDLDLRGWE